MSILHWQYHCCWWLGDARSQGISNYGIALFAANYPVWSQERVTFLFFNPYAGTFVTHGSLRHCKSLFRMTQRPLQFITGPLQLESAGYIPHTTSQYCIKNVTTSFWRNNDFIIASFVSWDARLNHSPWWRHQMEIFCALLAICAGNSPVTGEFPTQRPVTRSFDVFSDLRLNKRLSKQWWGWWFETPPRPLWRHYNYWRIYQSPRREIKLNIS